MTLKNALKTKLLPALAAAGMAVSLFASPVLAAETDEVGTQAQVSFKNGDLHLQNAPGFDFGSGHDINMNSNTTLEATAVSGNLRVADLRGNGAGWLVTAEMSGFTNADGATLQGAQVKLANATVSNPYDPSKDNGESAPSSPNSITLNANDPVKVFEAAQDTGKGTWEASWDKDDVTLDILPGTAEPGSATADINWTFTDAL